MNLDTVLRLLGWCTLINWAFLLFWWGMIAFAGDFVYRVHGKWFKMSRDTFDAMHYGGMVLFKMIILVCNLAPYLAMRFFL
jgi:hypothetical protein